MKRYLSVLILLFAFSSAGFSAQAANSPYKEFNIHKPDAIKIIGKLKPNLKVVVKILEKITSKNTLLAKRENIIKALKKLTLESKSVRPLIRKIEKKKRLAFVFWFLSIDREYMHLVINTRKHKKRIGQIPGCRPILRQIDNELKAYRKTLNK